MPAFLHTAANGHLTLELTADSDAPWDALVQILENQHGFARTGSHILGGDSTIYQNFTRPDFTLEAGWDIYSGNYLLASSQAGDDFLVTLFEQIHRT